MVLWKFDELLIIDVTLYSTALFLEFSSLVALRRSAPGVRRPFRIPLGVPGLVVLALVPGSCLLLALYGVVITSDIHANAVIFTGAAILSGPAAWGVVRWRKPEMAMPAPALPAQAAGDPPRGT
jgi:amino acid transporter